MIRIRKKNEKDQVTWEYSGEITKSGPNFVTLEAFFNRPDMPFQDILLKRGDLFIETFFSDRWFNIFEIYDRDDHTLKGWYCNVASPFTWDAPDILSYMDLYLDLWVSAEGVHSVLDVQEFENADLEDKVRKKALHALEELQSLFKTKQLEL